MTDAEFQAMLSAFADMYCRHYAVEWYGPPWPDPGVTVLLTHQAPERLNGVWKWDGERWERPTRRGAVDVVV